jgi:hypothetical protein
MNKHGKAWQRLAAAARQAPVAGDASAPFGFSTRVAALAFVAERGAPSIFGRLALRAAVVAGLLAVLAIGVNYSAIKAAFEDEPQIIANDDPIAEVVDIGS